MITRACVRLQIDTGFFVKLKFIQFGYTRENKICTAKNHQNYSLDDMKLCKITTLIDGRISG